MNQLFGDLSNDSIMSIDSTPKLTTEVQQVINESEEEVVVEETIGIDSVIREGVEREVKTVVKSGKKRYVRSTRPKPR